MRRRGCAGERRMRSLLALGLTGALVAVAGCNARGSAMRTADMENMTTPQPPPGATRPSSPVHSISLPHDEAFAPPGPGRPAFVTACIVCHSTRYITSQPPFSRLVWKGIVEKMIHNYGAHVTAPQAAEIVDYLAATNGAHSIGDEGE